MSAGQYHLASYTPTTSSITNTRVIIYYSKMSCDSISDSIRSLNYTDTRPISSLWLCTSSITRST